MSTRDPGHQLREVLRKVGDEAGPAPDFESLTTGGLPTRPKRAGLSSKWLVPAAIVAALTLGAAVALWPDDQADDLETVEVSDQDEASVREFVTAEDLVAAALTAGYEAHILSEPLSVDPIVPGRERRVCLGAGLVRVFEYESVAARSEISTTVSPDGQLPDGIVEWIGAPRFFASGRLLVLHLGTDSLTTGALEDLMGTSISPSATSGRGSPDYTDSCADDSPRPRHEIPTAFIAELDRVRLSPADVVTLPYATASEATPGTEFVIDGEGDNFASDVLVRGAIVDVAAGASYSWPNGPQVVGGPPTVVEHDFNSPDSWVTTIKITVDVDEFRSVDGRNPGETVEATISLFSVIDFETISEELLQLEVLVLLVDDEEKEGSYALAFPHRFFGVVDAEGEMVDFVASSVDPAPIPIADLLAPEVSRIEVVTVNGSWVRVSEDP